MTDKRKATSIDIAYRAGVSQSTVSRALSGSPLVSEETRKRIQAIAEELHYKVDKNASGLRTQSTKTLALLLCEDPSSDDSHINPFFLSLLGGITRATARRNYDLLVSFQQLSQDWLADYEEANRADGLILLGYGDYQTAKDKLLKLKDDGAHFVLWGPDHAKLQGHAVGCDNYTGAYLATEHMINSGRRSLAFVGDTSAASPEFKERYAGFIAALEAHQLPPSKSYPCASSENEGTGATQQALSENNYNGLVCASDSIAIGAMAAANKAGLRIPQDIAISGFDDIPTAAHMTPSLTTVRQSMSEAGELLVSQLFAQMSASDGPSESVKLMPTLITRDSTGTH